MIREILSWLVITCCGIPVLRDAHKLLRNYATDKRTLKQIAKAEATMNKDRNFNTVWLYDNPVGAEKQAGDYGWGWHACMICIHLYVAHGENHRPADWKVGYSCLASMEVHVIGYCNKHYTYWLNELGQGRVKCHCGEEAGIIHNFEEILPEPIIDQ